MIDAIDLLFLRRAVELAERGLFSVAENPRVGCVVVRNGEVIGRGWHARTGGPHAEANAIADAGGDIRGATVYVSLEPCCHTGRQPPCTTALITAGAARVVGAMDDPDPRVAGRGYRALRDAGIDVDSTNLDAARDLNAGFVKRLSHGLPLVRVKLAASLDGRTAMANGESRWITSAAARSDVQYWRARSAAIVTGIGTVLADDPALTVREERFTSDGQCRQPLIAIADSQGRTPKCAKVLQGPGPVLIFTAEDKPCLANGEVIRCGSGRVDLLAMLKVLAGRGCNEVLVEAGPALAGAFLGEGLWDEAIVYVAPKLLGATARPLTRLAVDRLADAVNAEVASTERIGRDMRIVLRPTTEKP